MKKNNKVFLSHSEKDTLLLGNSFGKNIQSGISVFLSGDLGTGKTVFVRGVGESMGVSEVRSPSFTLISEYETKSGIFLIHVDLYRLDENGADFLGLDEYSGSKDCVMFIEWPERWKFFHDKNYNENIMKIFFRAINENEREIKIFAYGEKAKKILENLYINENSCY